MSLRDAITRPGFCVRPSNPAMQSDRQWAGRCAANPLAKRKIQKPLQIPAAWRFGAFLVCAIATAVAGVLLIWQTGEDGFDMALGRTLLTALLLTVITALLVSGVQSMVGVFADSHDG